MNYMELNKSTKNDLENTEVSKEEVRWGKTEDC